MDVHYVPNLRVRLLALVIVLLFIAPATAQAEGPDDTSSGWVGAGIALANLVYIPFKLGAAAFGTTVSGLAFLATFDREVASPIFWSTVGGDWVVTLGEACTAAAGRDDALPMLEASVNAFTRLWIGARSAESLALTDDLRGPGALLAALTARWRLPEPTTDWDY